MVEIIPRPQVSSFYSSTKEDEHKPQSTKDNKKKQKTGPSKFTQGNFSKKREAITNQQIGDN